MLKTTNDYSTFTLLHALKVATVHSKSSQCAMFSNTRCLVAVSNSGDPCCSHAKRLTIEQPTANHQSQSQELFCD
jgi:hypothetical protein